MEQITDLLNNSKILTGCLMLLMNIGSRYLINELPNNVDKIFDNMWFRRLIIFAIVFVATRDIKISILITLVFIFFFCYLFHENSSFCLINTTNTNELNKQSVVTKSDAIDAYKTLKKYKTENMSTKYSMR